MGISISVIMTITTLIVNYIAIIPEISLKFFSDFTNL